MLQTTCLERVNKKEHRTFDQINKTTLENEDN